MKKILFVILMACVCFSVSQSQTVLFSQTVQDYSIPKGNGPGLKKFVAVFYGIGLLLPVSDTTVNIRIPASWYFNFGVRTKRTITHSFSIGADYSFSYEKFSIRQTDSKIYPDTVSHDKQSVNFVSLGIGLYGRWIYSRHGNYLGKFVDLGIQGKWNVSARQTTEDKVDDHTTTVENGYKTFNPFNASAYLRLGFTNYSLTASYRLFSAFKQQYYKKELPPLTVGIDLLLN